MTSPTPRSGRGSQRSTARTAATRSTGKAGKGRKPAPALRKERPWGIIAASAVVVLLAVGLVTAAAFTASSQKEIPGVKEYEYGAGEHVPGTVAYEQSPPVGGQHSPQWQNCGVYTEPIPNETAVHSLEHGAVWITYSPDLPADQVEELQDLASGDSYLLLSPYEGLSAPVAASTWGAQVMLDSVDDERLERFIREYRNGPQTPEPGALCSGGVGAPIA